MKTVSKRKEKALPPEKSLHFQQQAEKGLNVPCQQRINNPLVKKMSILGASIGNCVHVAGIVSFLQKAEGFGFRIQFLGPAVPLDYLFIEIQKQQPDFLCISYRLTPQVAKVLLMDFKKQLKKSNYKPRGILFGGLSESVDFAVSLEVFDWCFIGDEPLFKIYQVLDQMFGKRPKAYISPTFQEGEGLLDRMTRQCVLLNNANVTFPLIRHHFGLPTFESTLDGIRKIARAEVCDIISLAPDQNTQEGFFNQSKRNKTLEGSGGTPYFEPKDFEAAYRISHCGNFPLLRCYAGTTELLKWAEMLKRTINNAWAAIPLFWYTELDGRSKRKLEDGIKENREAMKWNASHDIPVEVNDAHQWSLRDAPDAIAVAAAFLAAYNAKSVGVKHYIAQFMFNTPRNTAAFSDIAKMMATYFFIQTLEDNDFQIIRQVRAGLTHFAGDIDVAKGQLSASTILGMSIKPHIVHVVGFSEAQHAATAHEVIEACKIARGAIRNFMTGWMNPFGDSRIEERAKFLCSEASIILGTIRAIGYAMGSDDPWADPTVLDFIVRSGIMDAPHLIGGGVAPALIQTRLQDGGYFSYCPLSNHLIKEEERLSKIMGFPLFRQRLGKLSQNYIQYADEFSHILQAKKLPDLLKYIISFQRDGEIIY